MHGGRAPGVAGGHLSGGLHASKYRRIKLGCKAEGTPYSIGTACLPTADSRAASNDLGENSTFAGGGRPMPCGQAVVGKRQRVADVHHRRLMARLRDLSWARRRWAWTLEPR